MAEVDNPVAELKAIAARNHVGVPVSTDPLVVATELVLRLYRDGELPGSVNELTVLAHAAKIRGWILLETTDSVETGMSSLRTAALASFLSGAKTDRHDDHVALGIMYHLLDLPQQANQEFLAADTASRYVDLDSTWNEIIQLPPGSKARNRRISAIEGFAPYVFSEDVVRAREAAQEEQREKERRDAELARADREKREAAQREKAEQERAEQARIQRRAEERAAQAQAEREATDPARHARTTLDLILSEPTSRQLPDLLLQFQRQLDEMSPPDASDLVKDGAAHLIDRQEAPWLTMQLLEGTATWCERTADYPGLVWALVEMALRLRASGSHEDLYHAYERASAAAQAAQITQDFSSLARSAGALALLFLDARQPSQAVEALSQVTSQFPESSLTDDDERRIMARLLVIYAKALAGWSHETGDQSHMEKSTMAVTQAYTLFGLIGEQDGLNATRAELGI